MLVTPPSFSSSNSNRPRMRQYLFVTRLSIYIGHAYSAILFTLKRIQTRMVDVQQDLETFIVDCSEDSEKGVAELHLAAWRGDVKILQSLLRDQRYISAINIRLRPFLATPLRLAASNGKVECVRMLLLHGAAVDLPDNKNQTPLFCAVRSRQLRICKLLLEAGASPEGHRGNLSTPLQLACQDGFTAGVQMLLDHGAAIECLTGQDYRTQPPHPLRITVSYGHIGCFIALLCSGGLTASAPHCLHVICTRRLHSIFVKLWWQFGGSFWHRDASGLLAVDIPDNPLHHLLRTLMGTPLSLQSQCRLKLKRLYPKLNVKELPCTHLGDFLQFWDFPEVRIFQKMVREEINHPTGLDLEPNLKTIFM